MPLIPFTPEQPETVQPFFDARKSHFDVQLAFSQLMQHALPHYEPAQHAPHLKADKERAGRLREKYLSLSGAKKLVGIAWHSANQDSSGQRNIPLALWQLLFALPHVQYVVLQYGDHRMEIDDVNRRFSGKLYLDSGIDSFHDMDALAAQIAAMDEVVTIDNATVHLAGALGVKTTLLLSAASEWRWGLERTDNRRYASVYLERQEKILAWEPVMARVEERLS